MQQMISTFLKNDDGAVTVDWVVLTAAVVGLAVAAYATISSGTGTLTASTDTTLTNMTVGAPVIGGE
jgi:Flp pilus assembly pilin Flp